MLRAKRSAEENWRDQCRSASERDQGCTRNVWVRPRSNGAGPALKVAPDQKPGDGDKEPGRYLRTTFRPSSSAYQDTAVVAWTFSPVSEGLQLLQRGKLPQTL